MPNEVLDELYKLPLYYFRPSPFIGAAPPYFWARPMYFRHTPLWAVFRVRIDGKSGLGWISWPHPWEHEFPLFSPINTTPRVSFRLGFCLVKSQLAVAATSPYFVCARSARQRPLFVTPLLSIIIHICNIQIANSQFLLVLRLPAGIRPQLVWSIVLRRCQ